MLKRYDIHATKVWHKNFNNCDCVFVYHDVGSGFEEKMQGWNTSTHPFDMWFRENMLTVYDIENAEGKQKANQLMDFKV